MSGQSKNHTLKGGTSLYSLYMGIPPSPGLQDAKALEMGIGGIGGDWVLLKYLGGGVHSAL